MHTIKITRNLLFEYQCTSGKFIRLPNRIESKLFFALIARPQRLGAPFAAIVYDDEVKHRGGRLRVRWKFDFSAYCV